ncbi:MAG TPA: hypothetical protein P5081_09130 [Phycisphaerae bacterium]|nr:hypothetical protein [Phycisphaerae bacterium]HRW53039.1 hypothetical protein [Phycisphaerae bacterium]
MPDIHLQAPHIQLGFFWQDRPQEAAFAACLRWLIADGYELAEVTALRSADNRLPRCQKPAWLDIPDAEYGTFEDPDAETVLSSVDWLPIHCQLRPTAPWNVPVHLTYALLYEEALNRGDAHAIEIAASAASLNLLHTVSIEELSAEGVSEARRTRAWERRTFCAVCEALAPTCAADNWENALQPPAWLAEFGDSLDFSHFFVSQTCADIERIEALVGPMKAWTTERFANGLVIKGGADIDADDVEGAHVAESLREAFRGS